jgi:protein-disulfide isomerase
MAGDPYRGNPEAKVVVVEYSDFQCPACAEFANETQPAVQQKYVDSDQIMWVFKNLPLSSNPHAPVAAAAGECAVDQGKFWEMHDQLFATVTSWAVEEPDPPLRALAQGLGLDQAEFDACLSGRQAMERVLEDVYNSMLVTNSAPTFVILHNGIGDVTRGALSAERFNGILEQIMKEANSGDVSK